MTASPAIYFVCGCGLAYHSCGALHADITPTPTGGVEIVADIGSTVDTSLLSDVTLDRWQCRVTLSGSVADLVHSELYAGVSPDDVVIKVGELVDIGVLDAPGFDPRLVKGEAMAFARMVTRVLLAIPLHKWTAIDAQLLTKKRGLGINLEKTFGMFLDPPPSGAIH